MKRWRIYTPFVCRVVIEEDPDEWSRMKQFDGMTEEEVIEEVKGNILYRWPGSDLRSSTHWGKPAIDVSRDGTFYYIEPDTPPFLYHIARGF